MSESASNVWLWEPERDGSERSDFLGYLDLPPEEEAAMWREHDRAAVEYDDFFEDEDSA